MPRWLRELFRPSLRCERLGHAPRHERRLTLRVPAKTFRSVADQCEEQRQVCRRCRHVLADWQVDARDGLTGLSMPDEHWRILRRNGVFILD